MQRRRLFSRVIPISMLLLVVLFKFQNCGGPQAGVIASNTGGDEIRVIDRWQEQKVAFLSDTQFLVDPADAKIQGLCVGGSAPEPIAYEIIHTEGAEAIVQSSGMVDCRMGGFEIAVPELPFADCDDSYTVRAARQSGEGGEAYTNIRPYCEEG